MAQGGVKTGALGRSIRAMTVGAIDAHTRRRVRFDAETLQEVDHQFQVPISGYATYQELVEGFIAVRFESPLIDAPDNRQSPFQDPTFTSGFVLTSSRPVMLCAAVQRWEVEDDYFYVGARVRVMVFTPEPWDINPIHFKGEVHLNFQGYGPPATEQSQGVSEG